MTFRKLACVSQFQTLALAVSYRILLAGEIVLVCDRSTLCAILFLRSSPSNTSARLWLLFRCSTDFTDSELVFEFSQPSAILILSYDMIMTSTCPRSECIMQHTAQKFSQTEDSWNVYDYTLVVLSGADIVATSITIWVHSTLRKSAFKDPGEIITTSPQWFETMAFAIQLLN